MLDDSLKNQLRDLLSTRLEHPIELVASLDGSPLSSEILDLIRTVAGLSEKISLRENGDFSRRPSFGIAKAGEKPRIHFAGIPTGHEFTSLALALIQAGGYPPRLEEDMIRQIRDLPGNYRFETYISLSCHNCPDVVQALNAMASINPGFETVMIDGALYQEEVEQRQIMGVPAVWLNGEPFGQGRMEVSEILSRLDSGSASRAAEKLQQKEVFDVLVIGGGPAGSAAAIYAARKGVRVGLVAERFGGQIQDTLSIENLICVKSTEGPKLAASLEEHVRGNGVDLIKSQQAKALIPAENGKPAGVELAFGAVLRGKTLILASGARWRNMNVPGEADYLARGIAFCPHCDGPLFKGKRIAVIGGGNSGVEAAIDLAGITEHVTLLEFGEQLRADGVLQKKLEGLPNVTVIKQAETTAVLGDGQKVTGLSYKKRETGEEKEIRLEGIFVQIGLLPSTGWLKGGALELSDRGEIVVDAKGQTNLPGIFAAGDCTTVPYKQIIIAMGEGAKASLSAFDYLIRSTAA